MFNLGVKPSDFEDARKAFSKKPALKFRCLTFDFNISPFD